MSLPTTISLLGRLRICFKSSARRRKYGLACWLAIAFYSVLAIGLPIPVASFPLSDEVFPCMHHRCGCHSADQCWRDCCCMSMAEKLAWAKENDVTPPPYVLEEARSRGLLDSQPKPKCCCCKAPVVESCCKPPVSSSCCDSKKGDKKRVGEKPTASDSVVLLNALKCRGVGDNWMGVGISLPPPGIDFDIFLPFVAQTVEPTMQLCSWVDAPPTPPPRSSAA